MLLSTKSWKSGSPRLLVLGALTFGSVLQAQSPKQSLQLKGSEASISISPARIRKIEVFDRHQRLRNEKTAIPGKSAFGFEKVNFANRKEEQQYYEGLREILDSIQNSGFHSGDLPAQRATAILVSPADQGDRSAIGTIRGCATSHPQNSSY